MPCPYARCLNLEVDGAPVGSARLTCRDAGPTIVEARFEALAGLLERAGPIF
jgi:hypothetical protein